MTMHAFHAYKHTSDPQKVEALLGIAKDDLNTLTNALNGDHRDLLAVLERSLRSYGVKNSPFYRILKPTLQVKTRRHNQQQQQQLEKELLEAQVTAPKTLAYRFNNLWTPPAESIAHHQQLKQENKYDYYKFVKFLQKHNLLKGKADRKLFFEPTLAYTPLGNPAALCRQRNEVRKVYSQVLRDSHRPVHPHVIAFLDDSRQDLSLPRRYRRRLEELAEKCYSIDDDMQRIRSSFYS